MDERESVGEPIRSARFWSTRKESDQSTEGFRVQEHAAKQATASRGFHIRDDVGTVPSPVDRRRATKSRAGRPSSRSRLRSERRPAESAGAVECCAAPPPKQPGDRPSNRAPRRRRRLPSFPPRVRRRAEARRVWPHSRPKRAKEEKTSGTSPTTPKTAGINWVSSDSTRPTSVTHIDSARHARRSGLSGSWSIWSIWSIERRFTPHERRRQPTGEFPCRDFSPSVFRWQIMAIRSRSASWCIPFPP